MHIFLSKKVAMPNGVKPQCLSFNPDHGWLACGGSDGLLKVLKLDAQPSEDSAVRGVAATTTLSMNQTLEGHRSAVAVAAWNPHFRKLTTADESGLIIVWVLHKGMWIEDMINNRNKSTVADMKWGADGTEICIAYKDGAVIVGSVDGNRIWSREMGAQLALVEWSPDGQLLLFCDVDGAVSVHNRQGVRLGAVPLPAVAGLAAPQTVASLEWYDGLEGSPFPDAPSLAVAFHNGRVQLMRSESDAAPVLIDSGLNLQVARWSSNGSVLALAGMSPGGTTPEVQFYSPFGRYLTSFKVPGQKISAVSWEGGGLRLALAVDGYIYFATVRPDYLWAYFADVTFVYAFTRPERTEHSVIFWNTRSGERHVKYVNKLMAIEAAAEHCVLVTTAEAEETEAPSSALIAGAAGDGGAAAAAAAEAAAQPHPQLYILILCNAIGSPVESKYVPTRPDFVALTPTHVLVASATELYAWQFRSAAAAGIASANSGAGSTASGKYAAAAAAGSSSSSSLQHALLGDVPDDSSERVLCIDGSAGGGGMMEPPIDPITCIAGTARMVLVGRSSGDVLRYSLPGLELCATYALRCRPASLAINCTGTKFIVISLSNVVSIFDMESEGVDAAGHVVFGCHQPFEKKDVWAVKWAEDHPDQWCAMEKTRMYIFRGMDPEEPVMSSAFICRFRDLTVTSALLDEVMAAADSPPEVAAAMVTHEIRSLRDTRTLAATGGSLRNALQFASDNPHPRLWRLLAETALERLDLPLAEAAYVANGDYGGIQFVKRLRLLGDPAKQAAEVAAFFRRFDDAERMYSALDRADLALDMRMRVGDWERVLTMLTTSGGSGRQLGLGGGRDDVLALARTKVGDYWADRQKWWRAIPYYEAAQCYDALAECYYITENFTALAALVGLVPPGSPLLFNIGTKLQSVGLTEEAADALTLAGDIHGAVNCCVQLNQWDRAVRLSQAHSLPQIEGLLQTAAGKLLADGKTLEAVELFRRAKKDLDAARLLSKLAVETLQRRANPARAKALFVLAALQVERHRAHALKSAVVGGDRDDSSSGGGGASGDTAAASTAVGMGKSSAAVGVGPRSGGVSAVDSLLHEDLRASSSSSSSASSGAIDAFGNNALAARSVGIAWHGAEAVHCLLLAQRQLYAGDVSAAMTTSVRLPLFTDILDPRDVHSLVALTAYYNACFGMCSRAFLSLESIAGGATAAGGAALTADLATADALRAAASGGSGSSGSSSVGSSSSSTAEQYRNLALSIFSRTRPVDPPDTSDSTVKCPSPGCSASLKVWAVSCAACKSAFPACVATGRPLIVAPGSDALWQCATCRHKAFRGDIRAYVACPLCHAAIAPAAVEA